MIRRRHVIFVSGHDPLGTEGYYGLFQAGCRRFRSVWPIQVTAGPLSIDSEDLAHWDVEMAAPNWRVSTHYEFLRQEAVIRAIMAQPLPWLLGRALRWIAIELVKGTQIRILRASWRFGLVHIFYQCCVLWWIELAIAAGWLAALATIDVLDWPVVIGIIVGAVNGAAVLAGLRPLAEHLFVVLVIGHWPYTRELVRGDKSPFDRPIEAGARRLIAAARSDTADEIVVMAHSAGGMTAMLMVARALELDPDLGRHGPRVVLMTLGTIAPAAALHPDAVRLRAAVRTLACEPSLAWIDCQSRKDVLNLWDFDPVAGIGIDVGAERRNPLVWQVRFRDMVSAEFYRRLRWRFFRLHFQFIMAGDLRARYDYLMLIGGPLPVEQWARSGGEVIASFGPDGSYCGTDSDETTTAPRDRVEAH